MCCLPLRRYSRLRLETRLSLDFQQILAILSQLVSRYRFCQIETSVQILTFLQIYLIIIILLIIFVVVRKYPSIARTNSRIYKYDTDYMLIQEHFPLEYRVCTAQISMNSPKLTIQHSFREIPLGSDYGISGGLLGDHCCIPFQNLRWQFEYDESLVSSMCLNEIRAGDKCRTLALL